MPVREAAEVGALDHPPDVAAVVEPLLIALPLTRSLRILYLSSISIYIDAFVFIYAYIHVSVPKKTLAPTVHVKDVDFHRITVFSRNPSFILLSKLNGTL